MTVTDSPAEQGDDLAVVDLRGESIHMLERVIVAPALGVFRPSPVATFTTEGEIVSAGQTIGIIECSGDEVPAESRFAGFLMGLMASAGERVREGQPLAWIRVLEAPA